MLWFLRNWKSCIRKNLDLIFWKYFYNFIIIIINAVLWGSVVIFNFFVEDVFLFRNVFITGSAGVGKSFLLNEILKSLKQLKVYVTASTGVAACNIGGTTFHRFVVGLSFTFSVQFLTFCLYFFISSVFIDLVFCLSTEVFSRHAIN